MKKLLTSVLITALLMAGTTAFAQKEQNRNGTLPIYNIDIRQPKAKINLFGADTLPEKFDLRDVDGKSYVSSVKDQGHTNNCWVYTFIASAESCWLRDTGEEIDLSENHIDFATTRTINKQTNPDGTKNALNAGGQPHLAANYASRGSGLVLQEDFSEEEYSYGGYGDSQVCLSDIYIKPSFGVTDVLLSSYFDGNEPTDLTDEYYEQTIAQIKNDLYTNKTAVTANTLFDYDYEGNLYPTFYNPDCGYNVMNHGVTIVGWDDTYPAENFNVPPKGDGAWITKDSWGTEVEGHEDGFFYLSYYDLSIYCGNVQVTGMEDYRDGMPYDNRYYHDVSMFQDSIGYEDNGNVAYGMNVFKKQPGVENLTSVNIGFNGPTEYEVYAMDSVTYAESVDVSTLTPCASGSVERAGYYEIDLDESVEIGSDTFAVIVKYYDDLSHKVVPVSLKAPYSFWWYDYELVFDSGKSYTSPDGATWEDIGLANKYCPIKAFTTDVDKKSIVTIEKTGSGTDFSSTMVWIQDASGRRINPNADGTYSLADGAYYYIAERAPLQQYSTVYFEPVSELFEVSGDMTLTVNVPETEDTTQVTPPHIDNTTLHECSPYANTTSPILHSFGDEATDATIYFVDDNEQKTLLQKDVDYRISDYSVYLFKEYLPETDEYKNYLLGDDEFLHNIQNNGLTFEIQYNDSAQTTYRFYVMVNETDVISVLNTYIMSDLELTKADIESYMLSLAGTESITFSDDFVISPMAIDGTITVVYDGKTYTQNYDEYTRLLTRLKYIKKTKSGEMYKLDRIMHPDFESHSFFALYDNNNTLLSVNDEWGLQYIDVPYGDEPRELKAFEWNYPLYYEMSKPMTEALSVTVEKGE